MGRAHTHGARAQNSRASFALVGALVCALRLRLTYFPLLPPGPPGPPGLIVARRSASGSRGPAAYRQEQRREELFKFLSKSNGASEGACGLNLRAIHPPHTCHSNTTKQHRCCLFGRTPVVGGVHYTARCTLRKGRAVGVE